MSKINTYDSFVTESFKKEFKKLLHNITSYFGSDDDIEKLESDLLRLLTNYKNKILIGEIKKIDNQFIEGLKDAKTNSEGVYFFENIPDGKHTIKIDINSIPIEYIPLVKLKTEIIVEEGTTYNFYIPLKIK